MSINLDKLSNQVEYNILLIGHSRVDKSTFVNAFANYLKFESLDDAMKSEFEEVIPTIFEILENSNSGKIIEIKCDENEFDNEFDENGQCTLRARIYEFRCNGKLIRLIDAPEMKVKYMFVLSNEYLVTLSQCLVQYKHLHLIVLVTSGESLSFDDVNLLQTIHKSVSNKFVICNTNDNEFSENKKFQDIRKYTKITHKHCRNILFTIDNCAFECLLAHRQGYIFSDERIQECRTSWIEASEQIQTMIDWIGRRELCNGENMIEFTKSLKIRNLCLEIMKHYSDKANNQLVEIVEIVNSLKHNLTEYKRIENICMQLWSMTIYSSLVSCDGFEFMIQQYKLQYIDKQRFCEKMQKVSQNLQSFEEKTSEFSTETKDFKQLITELCNLQHSGSYFSKKIFEITKPTNQVVIVPQITISIPHPNDFIKYQTCVSSLVHLQQILSFVTENNLLLIRSSAGSTASTFDLSNATLHNVVFTCGQSTNQIRDFIVNETRSKISEEDLQFIVKNIDRLIKTNFDKLIPVIKNYLPVKPVIENEKHSRITLADSSTQQIPSISQSASLSTTCSSQPTSVSQYFPFMQQFNIQNSDHSDDDDLNMLVEQILKLKAKRKTKKQ